jgi:hypothetical protein
MSSFLLVALNKIYKSRDGLTAVSSNTSIMSELSNISKGSLPSSMPVPSHPRQTSTSSSTMSSSKNNHSTTATNTNANTSTVVQNSNQIHLNNVQKAVASVQKQTHATNSSGSALNSNQTLKERIQSSSSKQLQQLSGPSSSRSQQHPPNSSANITNSNLQNSASTATTGAEFQRRNTVHYETSRALKKPGQTLNNATHLTNQNFSNQSNPTTSSIPTINPQIHNRSNDPKSSLLLINTNNMLITCSSTSSPSAPSSSSSARTKTENKLNKEIERLEALCESRTKELSRLKLKLKQTIISFDAMAVAFRYLSVDVSEIFLYY